MLSCPKLPPLLLLGLDPARKLASLLANIHESRARLENAEWVPAVVLLHLAAARPETSLSLALNLSSPLVPLDGTELRGAQDQPKNDHQCCHQSFYGDINRKRARRELLREAVLRCR